MRAVMRRPPDRAALHGRRTEHGERELRTAAGRCLSLMGSVSANGTTIFAGECPKEGSAHQWRATYVDFTNVIEASLECLRPGGIAVHTTEFNCSSDADTLDNASTVLFRKRDFLLLQRRLKLMGAEMEFNFNLGQQPLDLHIDTPPYSVDDHLKLQIQRWAVTSFGLIVRKL